MQPPIEVFADTPALAQGAAAGVAERAAQAVAGRGSFFVAISGGPVLESVLAALAAPPWRDSVPWKNTRVFWCDERWAAHDPVGANLALARRALLDHVPVPPDQLHPVPVGQTPAAAAAAYSRTLEHWLSDRAVDLVVLGMGSDGHTAGLHPGSDALYTERCGATACDVPRAGGWLITCTLAEINRARDALLLVSGADAATTLADVRTGHSHVPAARVRTRSGGPCWMTDHATASAARAVAAAARPAAARRDDETARRSAGLAAAELVAPGMAIGLGTGSTASHFVKALGLRWREGELAGLVGVPTSEATRRLAALEGIPIASIADRPTLDLTVDGADEISPRLDLIKGLGGALVREKVVARASERMVVIADATKLSPGLGHLAPVPVAVVPFAWSANADAIRAMGAEPTLRRAEDGSPLVTDDGLFILDCRFAAGLDQPAELECALEGLPGVAATGLFLDLADRALIGDMWGVWSYRR